MKGLIFLVLLGSATACFSQGTVTFANAAPGVDAPVFDFRVTPAFRLSGPAFRAQLYVAPAGTVNHLALTTNGVSGTSAPFEFGAGAGYFLGGVRTIEGFAPGTTVTLQVRAWEAASSFGSWESAHPYARGESNLIQVTLGGGIIPPPNMVGLTSFSFPVPEPSSIALGLIAFLTAAVIGTKRRSPTG